MSYFIRVINILKVKKKNDEESTIFNHFFSLDSSESSIFTIESSLNILVHNLSHKVLLIIS